MGVTIRLLKEMNAVGLHRLSKRTYLTADGKVTTDEARANSLLGNVGDEIPADQARELGLAKGDADEAQAEAEPKMLFYNPDGKRVKAGAADVAQQFLDNDPGRPDAPKPDSAAETTPAPTEPAASAPATVAASDAPAPEAKATRRASSKRAGTKASGK